jgi:hypothetical protein
MLPLPEPVYDERYDLSDDPHEPGVPRDPAFHVQRLVDDLFYLIDHGRKYPIKYANRTFSQLAGYLPGCARIAALRRQQNPGAIVNSLPRNHVEDRFLHAIQRIGTPMKTYTADLAFTANCSNIETTIKPFDL